MKKFKPDILIRSGNKFKVNKKQILPYMKKHTSDIEQAVLIACQDYKKSPRYYKGMTNKQVLDELNELIYVILGKWGIYKE